MNKKREVFDEEDFVAAAKSGQIPVEIIAHTTEGFDSINRSTCTATITESLCLW